MGDSGIPLTAVVVSAIYLAVSLLLWLWHYGRRGLERLAAWGRRREEWPWM